MQYHSDSDFCLRAVKKGYKVFINWDWKIFSHFKETSKSSTYIKKSFPEFVKSFFNPVTRNYLPSKIKFNLRHSNIILFLPQTFFFVLVSIKNYLFPYKNYT